ncbi:MAG: hypothetical protein U0263_09565 [Polyangiaceae bacterium]
MAPMSSACIVSDPAEYGVAKQTPPFLDATAAAPSVLHRKDVASNQTFQVTVPFRSEDVGDEIVAQLFLDYNTDGEFLLRFEQVPPGKFEEQRTIDIPSVSLSNTIVDPGCYVMTLVVTHRSNLNAENRPVDPQDTSILTWIINFDDDGENRVNGCPKAGGVN